MRLKEKFTLARLLPFLPIALGPIILFSPILFTGRSLYWGIPALQFIPWRLAAWSSLSKGTLPLWNPLNGMGAPLLANYQLALFYPPSWLLYFFQAVGGVTWMAWAHTLLSVGHLIWAGIGMAFLMSRLGFGERGQVISGLSLSLCAYLVARSGFFSIVWAAAWMPWVFAGASTIAAPVRGKGFPNQKEIPLCLILSTTMLLLAGHAQISWYILTLATLWIVIGAAINANARVVFAVIMRWAGAVLGAALLASIQLVPTAEYLLNSQRASAVDFEVALSYSFWPWRFLTLLVPDFFGNPGMGDYWGYGNFWEDAVYIGILPILLSLLTLKGVFRDTGSKVQPYRPLIWFCWGTVFSAALLALGKNTPIFPFLYKTIPTFDMFNAPTRYMILAEFSLTLLAGVAAEILWRRPTGRGLYWTRLATAGATAVTLGSFVAWRFMGDISSTFIRSTALAGLWSVGAGLLTLFMPLEAGRARRRWWWMVLFWVGIDLLSSLWWINPSVPASFYTAAVVELEQERSLLADGRLYLDPAEENAIKYDRFLRFEDFHPIEDPFNIRRVILPNLNILEGIASVNNFDPFVPERFAAVMEHVSGRAPGEKRRWLQWMGVSLWEEIDINLSSGVQFRPVEAAEPVRWVGCAEPARKPSEAFLLLQSRLAEGGGGASDRVVLEIPEKMVFPLCSSTEKKPAVMKWNREKPGEMSAIVQAPTAGFLLFAETGYPGWSAHVDGAPVRLYRADYLFQAVAVAPGEHIIKFAYCPISFYMGSAISGISGLILILWFRNKGSKGGPPYLN